MADFEPLFELKNQYRESCPVLLQSGALHREEPTASAEAEETETAEAALPAEQEEAVSPRTFLRLAFRNIDPRAVTSVYVDIHIFDKATNELAVMRDRGVCSFMTYFAYDHLRLDDAETLEVLEELKRLGGILCVHCENGTLVNELQKHVFVQGNHGPEGHALSRPDVCEAEAVSRLLYLAHLAGDAPVNVVHLSTKLGLEAIRAAKARGQKNIYVETCPQYLMLDDTCYLEQGEDGFAGAKYVMSPPLRHAGDRAALREALVAGEIDTIATDHCSFNLHGQKDRGRDDFRAIPNGGPGVEHRPVAIATSFEGQLGPEDLCRLMSENPARVFGMYPRKGCLAEGSDADVCVWDPCARWTISAATQHQAVDYTPLEGFEAHGRAKAVFVNGVLVARDGEPTGAQPGRYVPR